MSGKITKHFNNLGTYWKGNIKRKFKKTKRHLPCAEDNFLTLVTEPTKADTLQTCYSQTRKYWLKDVKVSGELNCSDHETAV